MLLFCCYIFAVVGVIDVIVDCYWCCYSCGLSLFFSVVVVFIVIAFIEDNLSPTNRSL